MQNTLAEVYEENLASQSDESRKERSLLIAIWGNCGFFFFIVHQSSVSINFLIKVNGYVEPETIPGRFCMVFIKIHHPCWNLNVLFYSHTVLKRHALVVSKIVSHGFPHIFQMLAQFVIQLQKLSFMNSITGLMSQVYKYWKAVMLTVAFTSCYNIPWVFFSLESLCFIVGYKCCQLFSKLTLFIFKKMSTKCPRINNPSLPGGFSNRNGIQRERATFIHKCFLSVSLLYFAMQQKHFMKDIYSRVQF